MTVSTPLTIGFTRDFAFGIPFWTIAEHGARQRARASRRAPRRRLQRLHHRRQLGRRAVTIGEMSSPSLADVEAVVRENVTGHVDDILAKKPVSVWLQSGIRNDAAAEIFAKAGIKVVQDR